MGGNVQFVYMIRGQSPKSIKNSNNSISKE